MAESQVYVEHEGAVFRGPSRPWPEEIWSPARKAWVKYEGRTPKDVDWGSPIDAAEVKRLTGADA